MITKYLKNIGLKSRKAFENRYAPTNLRSSSIKRCQFRDEDIRKTELSWDRHEHY